MLPKFRNRTLPMAFLLIFVALGASCGGNTYVVREGDSLPDIALEHEIALSDLIRANQDQYPALAVDPEHPPPGIELVIPGEGDTGLGEWFARLTCATSPPITPAPLVPAATNDKIDAVVQLVQRGINLERATHNLQVLTFDSRLGEIAQSRSNDMIRRAYFSHDDPRQGSVAFQDLIRSRQYRFLFAGENIAEIKNQGSLVPSCLTVYSRYGTDELANQIVTGWINSQEHRENILNSHFKKTGIALGVAVDGTRIVATQIFSD
jgi:uncharacterized protein YkwD